MVILHVEMASQVVCRNTRFDVVGRVDVEPVSEYMGRRVGGIQAADKGRIGLDDCTGFNRNRLAGLGPLLAGCCQEQPE